MAFGSDNTVYVQAGSTLHVLTPKELKAKQSFTMSGAADAKNTSGLNVTTPVVFAYKGRDLIASAGPDGRLYLLDSKSIGGEDHKTPLYQTPPVASSGSGIWGALSTWLDGDSVRWVLAPVWGQVNPELKFAGNNGDAPNGSIVAFKVEDRDGKTVLTPAWASRNMRSPQPAVITSGIVFALSAGDHEKREHATLYALDAATGKEVYSTGDQITAPASLTGITLANGRVFFTTTDNTLYGFGLYLER
jgi:hypothetical protein